MKRLLDVTAASVALCLLSPLFLLVAALVKLDSRGPVFFRQQRIGRGMRPFDILKFRTMVVNAAELGAPLTVGADPRITRVGRWLRMTKLDELPQLLNVMRGEMSLVGPRPEVPRYVELFRSDYEQILVARPGITGLASIKYRDEAAVLAQANDPELEYETRILPEKIEIAKAYLQQSSIWLDLKIIAKTIVRLSPGGSH